MTKRMEVRCCCNPRKLMGWLEVEHDDASELLFFIDAGDSNKHGVDDETKKSRTCIVQLEIGEIERSISRTSGTRKYDSYKAIKSMDTPIEILRLIPGFEEYK